MSIFETWPKKWFGVWRETDADDVAFPVRAELVDTCWKPEDIAQLLGYLNQAPVAITSLLPHGNCTLCGDDTGDPGRWHSDGVWLWPGRLGHFVEKHSIRLPDEMVEHIRGARHLPPSSLDIAVEELPWPEDSGVGDE